MIYQNDLGCLAVIQKVGCFVRSCGLLAELKTKEELTAEQINRLWRWAKTVGYINENNCLLKSAEVATYALRMLGDSEGRFIEVGVKTNGAYGAYRWASSPAYKPTHFIEKIKQNGPSKTHFRVVDENNNLIVDPHDPPINKVGTIHTICYVYK